MEFDMDNHALDVKQNCIDCEGLILVTGRSDVDIKVHHQEKKVDFKSRLCLPETTVEDVAFGNAGFVIWTFVKSIESLTVYLDGTPLVDIVYSLQSKCEENWSTVKGIRFYSILPNQAEYRQSPKAECTKFPSNFPQNIHSDTSFPVTSDTVLSVSLSCSGETVNIGSTDLTCYAGSIFNYAHTPQCLPKGECTGLYPGWSYVKTDTKFPVESGTTLEVTCFDGISMLNGKKEVTCLSGILYSYQDTEPMCHISAENGWIKPEPFKGYEINMENAPLVLLTNTPNGTSTEMVNLEFFDDIGNTAGNLQFTLASAPHYVIFYCRGYEEFANFPTEDSILWSIVITKKSFTVLCNGIYVVNIVYADVPDDYCFERWSAKLKKFRFLSRAITIVEYFRQPPQSTGCPGLPDAWKTFTETTATFPVSDGVKVKVSGSCSDNSRFFDSTEVICLAGTLSPFQRTPQCIPEGNCTGLYPGWNYLQTSTAFPVATGTKLKVTCYDAGFEMSGSSEVTCHNDIFYTYQDEEPLCTPSTDEGWLKPEKSTEYDIDFTESTLQVLSNTLNTESGTTRYMQIAFTTQSGIRIGNIENIFVGGISPSYRISFCECVKKEYPNLPVTPSKVWTIVKTEESITVHCNDDQVINIVFRDITDDKCKEKWSQDATKFKFFESPSYITTDFYRIFSSNNCNELPVAWKTFTETTGTFPVSNGDKVKVTGKCSDNSRFFYSTEVICLAGTFYPFSRTPQCIPEGHCTGLYPGWNYLQTSTAFPVATGTELKVTCYDAGFEMSGSSEVTCHNNIFYTYQGEEPLCTPSTDEGWLKPEELTEYDIDFTESLLQILSNTPNVTCESAKLKVAFSTASKDIGTFELQFAVNPSYLLEHCMIRSRLISQLPNTPSRVWTFIKTTESFTVHCNGDPVINIVFGEVADDNCKDKWSLDISNFEFQSDDSTTDFYRKAPPEICTGLPVLWKTIAETAETFPVPAGAKITITEDCPDDSKFFGSTELTCVAKTTYSFSKAPQCLPEGSCTGLKPAWSYLETSQKFPVPSGTKVEVSCFTRLQMSGSTVVTCHSGISFLYDEEPLCVPSSRSGWIVPEKDFDYEYDFTAEPLVVINNTPLNASKRKLMIFFYSDSKELGSLQITFSSIYGAQYEVSKCQKSPYDFPSSFPKTNSQRWSISLLDGSLAVECNGIRVIETDFTASNCDKTWSGNGKKIRFRSDDDTSDYFRQPVIIAGMDISF